MSYTKSSLETTSPIGMKALLGAIGSTEESTFSDVCRGLGDKCPSDENGISWKYFFATLNTARDRGYVTVSECGTRIDSMILTEAGVAEYKRLCQS